MELSIDSDVNRARQLFMRLGRKVKDMSPVWKLYAGFHRATLMPSVFATNGQAMTGRTWPDYAPSYKKRKKKLGGLLGQKLVLSGELKKRATNPNISIIKQSLKMSIEGLPYIRVPQFGDDTRNIKQRQYFFRGTETNPDLPPKSWAFLLRATDNHLLEGMK